MIIPALHFCGDCIEAIALYEKAFNTKAETIITNRDFEPDGHVYADDHEIAHAEMTIRGTKVFMNDRFGNERRTTYCGVRLIIMFKSVDELLACYEYFKDGSEIIDEFEKVSYSELAGIFLDKFGVQWGFMVGI